MSLQHCSIRGRCILHTTIVMDQFSPRLAALQGRDQGVDAKIGFESVIDQPTIWRVAMSLIAAK